MLLRFTFLRHGIYRRLDITFYNCIICHDILYPWYNAEMNNFSAERTKSTFYAVSNTQISVETKEDIEDTLYTLYTFFAFFYEIYSVLCTLRLLRTTYYEIITFNFYLIFTRTLSLRFRTFPYVSVIKDILAS
jgi:hypothetical protein